VLTLLSPFVARLFRGGAVPPAARNEA